MKVPLTTQEAEQLIYVMESQYDSAFAQFEDDDKFYDGDIMDMISAPEEFDVTIPTTARAIVDEAVDNVDPQDIHFVYHPRGDGPKAEKDADLVRRLLKYMWQYWRSSGSDIDVLRDLVKNLAKNGFACLKIVPDVSLWPSLTPEAEESIRKGAKTPAEAKENLKKFAEEIKLLRQEHFPIICRSLSPRVCMPDPTVSARKLWFVERYNTTTADIRANYAGLADFGDDILSYFQSTYQIHEVWTASHFDEKGAFHPGKHWVFINFECQLEEDNTYEDLPYVWKFSGYGRESYDGKPELKAVGFYTPQVKSMLLAQARRYTHFDSIISQLAWPVALVPRTLDMKSFSLAPGALNQVPDNIFEIADKIWMKAPIPHPEYMATISVLEAQIDRGTIQRALRGAGVPGTDSAAQLASITAQARLRIDSLARGLKEMMVEANKKALKYIDRTFGDRLSIYAAEEAASKISVGPNNIRGHYMNDVVLMPNEEQQKERKLVLAGDAMTRGMSRYDAFEYAGFEDPAGMVARGDADMLMKSPLLIRAMGKRTLEDWGIDAEQLELEMEMEKIQQQVQLRDYANILQAGSAPGAAPAPANPNNQDPTAALAQFGPPGLTQGIGAPAGSDAMANVMSQINGG